MNIIDAATAMQSWSRDAKKQGKRIAFVPTMGSLHEGHLSLLREGKRLADRLVLSIYVNPTQFGPAEDFHTYPRDTEGDLAKVRSLGVDAVFFPTDHVMYPPGYQTFVTVEEVSQGLCGATRPGHFRGVATIVLKLFNIVQPDVALFGEKDYQQLQVIRRLTADLNLAVEIKGMPIVREPDGLAMSSRNTFLNPTEREAARSLNLSLKHAQQLIANGERDTKKILAVVHATLTESPLVRIDYVKLCNPESLVEQRELNPPPLLALAAYVGKTRLIDNCILTVAAPRFL